jgi:hypothetical protein
MKKSKQSKLMALVRSSLLGHVLIFGLVAGGLGALAFSALLRTEGLVTITSLVEIFTFWVLCMALIGVLYWYRVTFPAQKAEKMTQETKVARIAKTAQRTA